MVRPATDRQRQPGLRRHTSRRAQRHTPTRSPLRPLDRSLHGRRHGPLKTNGRHGLKTRSKNPHKEPVAKARHSTKLLPPLMLTAPPHQTLRVRSSIG